MSSPPTVMSQLEQLNAVIKQKEEQIMSRIKTSSQHVVASIDDKDDVEDENLDSSDSQGDHEDIMSSTLSSLSEPSMDTGVDIPVDNNRNTDAQCTPHTPKRVVINIEDSPVRPGVDGHNIKSFEDLLNRSLRNEPIMTEGLVPTHTEVKKPINPRPFLKKGEGLQRFQPRVTQSTTRIIPLHIRPSAQRVCKITTVNPRNKNRVTDFSFPNVEVITRTDTLPKISRNNAPIVTKEYNIKRSHAPIFNQKKSVDHHQKECPKAASADAKKKTEGSSLDNLERLLEAIRLRKNELMDRSRDEDDDESSDSWEEEDTESEGEVVSYTTRHKASKISKKNGRKPKLSPSKAVMSAGPGDYSKSLKRYMRSLEVKLSDLQLKSISRMEQQESTGRHESQDVIRNEIKDLREHIMSLSDAIKTLQLLTGEYATEKQKAQPTKKQPKVVITRETAPKTKNSPSETTDDRIVKFDNGDQMQVLMDSTIIYRFANGTVQTTFPDGTKLLEFKNGQLERCLANGVRHITYPNHSQRTVYPDGSEEIIMSDGTVLRLGTDGTEVVILPNGEREIRSSQFTRREYRNGTVKTVYADGTQETRYPTGRLRIKDRFNNLLVDSIIRPVDRIDPV